MLNKKLDYERDSYDVSFIFISTVERRLSEYYVNRKSNDGSFV